MDQVTITYYLSHHEVLTPSKATAKLINSRQLTLICHENGMENLKFCIGDR